MADYAIYCNEDNGWCGSTSDHEHAQSSDMYDWEPKSCKSKNWWISSVFVDYKRKKFIAFGNLRINQTKVVFYTSW